MDLIKVKYTDYVDNLISVEVDNVDILIPEMWKT